MAVSYKAHTTLSDLKSVALGSSDILDDTNNDTAIEALIDDVSEYVDDFLGYQVIVRKYEQRLLVEQWRYDRVIDVNFIDADYYPIVEIANTKYYEPGNTENDGFIVAPTDIQTWTVFTGGIIRPGNNSGKIIDNDFLEPEFAWTRFEVADPVYIEDYVIEYYAGYRRSDQTVIGDFTSDLLNISIVPYFTIPRQIKRATQRICLIAIAEVSQGLAQRQIQNLGDRSITIESVDPNAVQAELNRIKHLKRYL